MKTKSTVPQSVFIGGDTNQIRLLMFLKDIGYHIYYDPIGLYDDILVSKNRLTYRKFGRKFSTEFESGKELGQFMAEHDDHYDQELPLYFQ